MTVASDFLHAVHPQRHHVCWHRSGSRQTSSTIGKLEFTLRWVHSPAANYRPQYVHAVTRSSADSVSRVDLWSKRTCVPSYGSEVARSFCVLLRA